jgi:hypothetical protein
MSLFIKSVFEENRRYVAVIPFFHFNKNAKNRLNQQAH